MASDLHLSSRPTPSLSTDATTKMPYTPLGLDTQHSTQYSLAGGGDSAREARLWKLAAGVSAGVAAVFGCALALTAGVGAAPAALLAEMRSEGLQPNLITYATVAKGLCLSGELQEAEDLHPFSKRVSILRSSF